MQGQDWVEPWEPQKRDVSVAMRAMRQVHTCMLASAWHRLQDLRQPGPRSVAPSIMVGFATHWLSFSQPGQSGCTAPYTRSLSRMQPHSKRQNVQCPPVWPLSRQACKVFGGTGLLPLNGMTF